MQVKFKKLHPDAVLPKYAKDGDAGMDLTCVEVIPQVDLLTDETTQLKMHSGIAVEIPKGYVGLIFPRSSIRGTGLRLSNCVGVIDSGYRGEIMAFFDRKDPSLIGYEKGDRFGQLIILPYPQIEPEWSDELSDSERGFKGFGSTGN